MPLLLVGGGYAEGLQTVEALDALRAAEKVYVDTYTVPGSRWLLALARRVSGGAVVEARRSVLEEGSRVIVEEALSSVVAVLVAGDPLIATTHASLLAEAARAGAEVRVLPGVSGVCAAKSVSLLHYYRFGRTVTVPGPWRGVKAYSVVEALYGNMCVGLHTMLLLDVAEGGSAQLSPGEALRSILRHEAELAAEAGFEPSLEGLPALIVSAGARGDHYVAAHSSVGEALQASHPEGRVYSVIVPAEPHPSEEWVLREVHGFKGYERGAYERASRVCSLLEYSPRGVSIRS